MSTCGLTCHCCIHLFLSIFWLHSMRTCSTNWSFLHMSQCPSGCFPIFSQVPGRAGHIVTVCFTSHFSFDFQLCSCHPDVILLLIMDMHSKVHIHNLTSRHNHIRRSELATPKYRKTLRNNTRHAHRRVKKPELNGEVVRCEAV